MREPDARTLVHALISASVDDRVSGRTMSAGDLLVHAWCLVQGYDPDSDEGRERATEEVGGEIQDRLAARG